MRLKEDMCYRRQERVIELRLVLFFCIWLIEKVARDSIESITKHSEAIPVQSRITLDTQLKIALLPAHSRCIAFSGANADIWFSDWFKKRINTIAGEGRDMVMMWSKLEQPQTRCLHSSLYGTPSDGILRFNRRNGFMIVPPSNPPNQGQGANAQSKRSIYSEKCPNTLPRAAVAKSVVSPSPTTSGCFAENAAIIGCGRNKTSKWLTSWRDKMRAPAVTE